MPARRYWFIVASTLTALIIAGGCTVANTEYHGAYADYGLNKHQIPPVTVMMFNYALQAVQLPAGAVQAETYVSVYRLSSGKAEDAWWTYMTEDWLIDKIRASGATPLERNAVASKMLAAEDEYFPLPKRGGDPAGGYINPKAREMEEKRIPFRANRALEYRVVAADMSVAPPNRSNLNRQSLRATATVILNLRSVDVRTGEILWSGMATGSATKDVPVSWFGDMWPWCMNDDWDDWDDDHRGPWLWQWEAGPVMEPKPSDPQPTDPAPGGNNDEEPANDAAPAPGADEAPDENDDNLLNYFWSQ